MELLIIGGAALGALIISTPMPVIKNIIKQLEKINASMDTLNRTIGILAGNSKQNDTGPGPVDRFPNTDEKRDHRPENPEK